MGNMVCGGAVCSCSFGMSPSMLMVTPENQVVATQAIATILDNVPIKNIMPFGMCSNPSNPMVAAATAAAFGVLTPMPCIPVTSAPWTPGAARVLVANKPVLTLDSRLVCSYGGIIQINSPGTFTISVS